MSAAEVAGAFTVRVDVTAEDIRAGIRRSCQQCPVALAIGRALGDRLPQGHHVKVRNFTASINPDDGSVFFAIAELPTVATFLIRVFDERGLPLPISFPLTFTPA